MIAGLNGSSSQAMGSLLSALQAFWHHNDPIEMHLPPLRVLVMGYTPIADAHRLHSLVLQPDQLPLPYAQVIANPAPALGEMQMDNEAEMQMGDEGDGQEPQLILWDEREASILLNELGININFTVTNYGLLWAKAEKFCSYTYVSDAYVDLLARLTLCDNNLNQPAGAVLANLRENLEHARRNLIFAMYHNDSNPHDVIQLLFPQVHDHVYQACVHCQANPDADEEPLDPPDTMLRLYEALFNLGLPLFFHDAISIDQARVELMNAEGMVEGYEAEFNSRQIFNDARDYLRQALLPLLNVFHVASHQPSVMGVPPPPFEED